jgi:predicted CXXCH cytochrome family protein
MNHLVRFILTIFVTLCLPLVVQAIDFQACYDCHKLTLAEDATRPYLHDPFIEEECGECHTAGESAASKTNGKSSNLIDRRKIKWLMDSPVKVTSHGFLLSGDNLDDNLVIDLHGIDGQSSRHEIPVPTLAELAEVEDSGKPPAISEVRVLKMEQGVFLKVTISWQTDILADDLVHYGIQDLSQTSEPSKRLGRQHEVDLYNLQPDTIYRFTAVSHDVFGRSQVSEPLTFSTAEPLTAAQQENSDNPPEGDDQSEMITSFKRRSGLYLLELKLKQPASVFIGSIERRGLPEDEFHTGLSSRVISSMEACLNCHDAHAHAVNVSPKPGIVVPPEFPTLLDGRITCGSCHFPHSSDNYYFTRKSGTNEFCVSCHQKLKRKTKTTTRGKNSIWR